MDTPSADPVDLFKRATELCALGDLAQAAAFTEQSITHFQQADGENTPNAANLLNVLASLREEQSDYAGAVAAAEQSTKIVDTLGDDFTGEDATYVRIEAWSRLGNLYRHLARYPEAEALLVRALALAINTFGETADATSIARNNLGILYKYTGNFDAAKTLYDTALANIENELGREHHSSASLYHNLGGLAHARGDFAAGEAPARKAWEIRSKYLGADHPDALADAVAYAGVLDGLDATMSLKRFTVTP